MSIMKALVVVDVQNDFLPGGALGVPSGDRILPALDEYVRRFHEAGLPIIATRDLHPPATIHFQSGGGKWPPHCIEGTPGAAFSSQLALPPETIVVSKGMDPTRDSYSAFDAKGPDGEAFDKLLHRLGVARIYLGGLATDYCVRATTLDALRLDFQVTVLEDAIAGITPESSRLALDEIKAAGAKFITLPDLNVGRQQSQST